MKTNCTLPHQHKPQKFQLTLPNLRHRQQAGEWAEALFNQHALREGLATFKPWGGGPVDFVVADDHKLSRVQVRATTHQNHPNKGYLAILKVNSRGHEYLCTRHSEFVAVYTIPEDDWYIIPSSAIRGLGSIVVARGNKYERYREAWHLLKLRRRNSAAAALGVLACPTPHR